MMTPTTQLNKTEIVKLLSLDDFSSVYAEADEVRRKAVGDVVHLRAIIEFSNICKRQCIYCGLNRDNRQLQRFRMSPDKIVEVAAKAVAAGYRTIVLQSGEDDYFTAERLGNIVRDIKKLKVGDKLRMDEGDAPYITLSCGERNREELKSLREAGADRYLLKHETANTKLYESLHPCGTLENRLNCLKTIYDLGYETGSGFMIGLPGQTLEMIAEDLLLLKKLSCKMAGIGPFISNPKTMLARAPNGDPELARRAVAIARLLLPEANLPVTTSLSVLSGSMKNPFTGGANVIMKKVTPDEYKSAYEIYPADFARTDIEADRRNLEETIRSYGRQPL